MRPNSSLLHWLPFVAVALVVVAMVAHHLPRILAFQWAMLRYPFPTQGSESLIVSEAGRLTRGESIYVANGPDRHGFVSGPYPPLYFLAVAATLKLTPTVFAGGRAITFCSWLALLLVLGALVATSHGVASGATARDNPAPDTRRRAGLFGVAVAIVTLAAFSPGVIWAVRVKPTIPALALAALGLLAVQRFHRSPRGLYLWALIPFVAAYFTKQTTLAAAGAATLFLLVHAGWRAAARLAGFGALAAGVLFAAIELATGGQFFGHVVADRRLPWHAQLLWNFGALCLRDDWPLLAAAIVAAAVTLRARVPSVAPYYLLTALLLLPTVGVEGADHDHLIELALASSLALGVGLAATLDRQGRPATAWAAYPLVVLLGAQLATGWTPDRWYARELALPGVGERRQLDLIIHNLRNTEGEALAEEIGLLILAGKAVPYDDPQAMAALARAGRWDQRQLLDDLERQRFSLVILPANPRDELWTTEVLAAIRANYDLKFRDVWFTYEAKRLR